MQISQWYRRWTLSHLSRGIQIATNNINYNRVSLAEVLVKCMLLFSTCDALNKTTFKLQLGPGKYVCSLFFNTFRIHRAAEEPSVKTHLSSSTYVKQLTKTCAFASVRQREQSDYVNSILYYLISQFLVLSHCHHKHVKWNCVQLSLDGIQNLKNTEFHK